MLGKLFMPTSLVHRLYINISGFKGKSGDKLFALFYLIAHKYGKDFIGFYCILNLSKKEGSFLRVHCGIPKLLRVHFTKSFVALDVNSLFRKSHHLVD